MNEPLPEIPKGTWTPVPEHAAQPMGLRDNLLKLRALIQTQLDDARRKLDDARQQARRGG